jgi:hypothetical protein
VTGGGKLGLGAYDGGTDAGSFEGRDNSPQDHPAADRDMDIAARQRQDNAAIEARLDEASLPTRSAGNWEKAD